MARNAAHPTQDQFSIFNSQFLIPAHPPEKFRISDFELFSTLPGSAWGGEGMAVW